MTICNDGTNVLTGSAAPAPTAVPAVAPDDDHVEALGGGWYRIVVGGEPVDTVQGEDAARVRLDELVAESES